jgi:hypothetical protein
MAPSAFESDSPEFSVITGMPARSALFSGSLMASGSGALVAMPSTFWVTAALIS